MCKNTIRLEENSPEKSSMSTKTQVSLLAASVFLYGHRPTTTAFHR